MNNETDGSIGYTPDWLDEALRIRSGEIVLDPQRQTLVDWIQETYGGNPISVYLQTSTSSGLVGTLSVVSWDHEDTPQLVAGSPNYQNDAKPILDRAAEFGVFQHVAGLNEAVSVRQHVMRSYMAQQIIKRLPPAELKNVLKHLGIPEFTSISVHVSLFRIFVSNDEVLRAHDNPEFKARCHALLSKVVRANDPNGYVDQVPDVHLESETVLRETYNNDLWQFFK